MQPTDASTERPKPSGPGGFDVGAVINKALRAAGLIKGRD
jgi:hypothetical protein